MIKVQNDMNPTKVLPESYAFTCIFTNEELKVVSVLEWGKLKFRY